MIKLNELINDEELVRVVDEFNNTLQEYELLKKENEKFVKENEELKKSIEISNSTPTPNKKKSIENELDKRQEDLQQLEEYKTDLAKANKNLNEKENVIDSLQNQIAEQDASIKKQMKEIEANETKHQTEIKNILETSNSYKNQLTEVSNFLSGIEKEKSQLESLNKNLEFKISELNSKITELIKKRRNKTILYILIIACIIFLATLLLGLPDKFFVKDRTAIKPNLTNTKTSIQKPVPAIKEPAPNPINKYYYIIKVKAVKNERIAKTEVKKLQKLGYPSEYYFISSKKLYSIYIGPYSNYAQLDQILLPFLEVKPTAYVDSILKSNVVISVSPAKK